MYHSTCEEVRERLIIPFSPTLQNWGLIALWLLGSKAPLRVEPSHQLSSSILKSLLHRNVIFLKAEIYSKFVS